MKFFKQEDFEFPNKMARISAARYANAKLEREGKVVYGPNDREWYCNDKIIKVSGMNPTHHALLINIEPIEKEDLKEASGGYMSVDRRASVSKNWDLIQRIHEMTKPKDQCTHPKEKVHTRIVDVAWDTRRNVEGHAAVIGRKTEFICDCGARVQVKRDGFEVVE